MSSPSNSDPFIRLLPSVQKYAWGDPEFVPALLRHEATGEPYAELWYGAHRAAPAIARHGGENAAVDTRLDEYVSNERSRILGSDIERQFGELPYLLKILAAKKPLSVQVHPNARQARAGFERENAEGIPLDAKNRCYRDPHHKPELLVALEPFAALCGFRTPQRIQAMMARIPELTALLPYFDVEKPDLRTLLEAYFELDRPTISAAWSKALLRLKRENERKLFVPGNADYWALRANELLGDEQDPDPGLLFVFLLDLVHLDPGQAMFLPAGVPHAYLEGVGVEIMASSDNVLRAGLTKKHVDPAELLRVLHFEALAPPIITPTVMGPHEAVYATPTSEFRLSRIRLREGEIFRGASSSPETLLALPLVSGGDAKIQLQASEPTEVELDDTPIAARSAPIAARSTPIAARSTPIAARSTPIELRNGDACLVVPGHSYLARALTEGHLFRAQVPITCQHGTFRGHSPVPLAFGTSGLRGLVSDITDLEAYINTRGFIDFLLAEGTAVPGTCFALAGDLRPSTPRIMQAVARALIDAGMHMMPCGTIPTPALIYHATQNRLPSIMVTGSHIPFDRNGIKFNKPEGEVLKSDEPAILAAVGRRRHLEYAQVHVNSHFTDDGSLKPERQVQLPESTSAARMAYANRYLDAFPKDALEGMSIVVFEHSAVGRELLAEILETLGARVHAAGRSETFVAIDTEAISNHQLAQLQDLADQQSARIGPIDAIVSTDGDSDRPMVLGVDGDGRIHFLGGDVLGTIVSGYLGADSVAVPVSATDLVDAELTPRGVSIVRTKIGSPWVIAAMEAMPGERKVGFEANGGYLTGGRFDLEGGQLQPLPTRDAVLPIVAVLHAAKRSGCSLVDLLNRLPQRYSRSGLLDEVPREQSLSLTRAFGPPDSQELRQALSQHFGQPRGFQPIEHIDFTDGIRIRFHGGDVAHVRPSGNAPQLRIYGVASTKERAEEIVELSLREPDGILREMLTASTR